MRPRAVRRFEIEAFRHRVTDFDDEKRQPPGIGGNAPRQAISGVAFVGRQGPLDQPQDRVVVQLANRNRGAGDIASDASP